MRRGERLGALHSATAQTPAEQHHEQDKSGSDHLGHRLCSATPAQLGVQVREKFPDEYQLAPCPMMVLATSSSCRWDDALRAQSSLETRTSSADAIECGIHSSGPCLSNFCSTQLRRRRAPNTPARPRSATAPGAGTALKVEITGVNSVAVLKSALEAPNKAFSGLYKENKFTPPIWGLAENVMKANQLSLAVF